MKRCNGARGEQVQWPSLYMFWRRELLVYDGLSTYKKLFSSITPYHPGTMHSGVILHLSVEFFQTIRLEERVPQVLFALLIIVGVAVWRIWALTISPNYMGTKEPRNLPYLIPGM